MLKFRKAAKAVASTERFRSNFKKDRFNNLKDAVQERKKSLAPNATQAGDLNSKYEDEAKLEEDMKKLYNARYAMSDEDLSECGSGLEDALQEESSNEDDARSDSDEEEENKEIEVRKQPDGNVSDETVSLASDIQEMLEAQKNMQENQEKDESSEEDDDDDDVSIKSDFELDNIIDSDDAEESEEAQSQIDNQSSSEGVNYSALEAEEDSDAFSFTGMTESPTGRDSRSSYKSQRSKVSGSGKFRRRKGKTPSIAEEKLTIMEATDAQLKSNKISIEEETRDKIIEENEESFPDITYSRSVSDIEEYESDIFDLENEDIPRIGGFTYGFDSTDSEGGFSIPRARESDSDDVKDFVNEVIQRIAQDLENETLESENVDGMSNNEKEEQEEEELNQCKEDTKEEELRIIEKENREDNQESVDKKEIPKEEDIYEVENEDQEDMQQGAQESEQKESKNTAVVVESCKNTGNEEASNDEEKSKRKKDSDSLSESNEGGINYVPVRATFSYQMLRKKEKKMLKKKERMEILERTRKTHGKKKKRPRSPPPDPNIPSYKAKLAEEKVKIETIDAIIDGLMESMDKIIDEKTRERERAMEEQNKEETVASFIHDLLHGVNKEVAYREEKRSATATAELIIDDILYMWESQVEVKDMIQQEKELENLSTCIIMATMIVAARDVMGNEPYVKMLHKEPKYKATKTVTTKTDENKSKKERKRLSKKDREALRTGRKKRSGETTGKEEGLMDPIEDKMVVKDDKKLEEDGRKISTGSTTRTGKHEKEDAIIANIKASSKERMSSNESDNDKHDEPKQLIHVNADGESSGRSTAATIKRGEGARKITYDDDVSDGDVVADENSLGSLSIPRQEKNGFITREYPKAKLQQMENNEDESADVILTTLPKADKSEYCFQWVMNNTKIPSPPLKEPPKNRSDSRKKRLVKRAFLPKDRPESEASVANYRVREDIKVIFKRDVKSPCTDSVGSFVESGRESTLSMHTVVSISSHEPEPNKVQEEPLDKNIEDDINQYFSELMNERIERRDDELRQKREIEEKERMKRKEQQELIDSDKENNYIIDCIDLNENGIENENEESKQINSEEIDDNIINEENSSKDEEEKSTDETEESEDENASVKSAQSLLPSESTFVTEDPNERFPTPESEPEPVEEVKDEVKKKKQVENWVLASTTLIRWRKFKPVIREGATVSDYKAQLVKLRRSRFKDLSLTKPKSLSDLHKPVKIENFEVQREQRVTSPSNRSKRSQPKSASPRLVLPPIVIPTACTKSNQRKKKSNSFSSKEQFCLPDINATNSTRNRPQVDARKVKGAWH